MKPFWRRRLLVPALALWALEPEEDGRTRTGRIITWWLAAAVGQWFSNGALLVAPACVVVMIVVLLHRNGWRAASQFAVLGVSWLAWPRVHGNSPKFARPSTGRLLPSGSTRSTAARAPR